MEEMINSLNKLLADLCVFYRKLQNYHWNIQGKDFFIVHAKLEEYYDEVNEAIDEIAEHILALNGEPLGRMRDYLAVSTIQEAENVKITSDAIFPEVIKDFNALLEQTKQIKEEADKLNGYATSALMDDYIGEYSKKLWMLNQMSR